MILEGDINPPFLTMRLEGPALCRFAATGLGDGTCRICQVSPGLYPEGISGVWRIGTYLDRLTPLARGRGRRQVPHPSTNLTWPSLPLHSALSFPSANSCSVKMHQASRSFHCLREGSEGEA